jgi:hypothetical protein
MAFTVVALLTIGAAAQTAGTTGAASGPTIQQATILNPMTQVNAKYICGGQVSAGTPIAGNAAGLGTSGVIPLAGIPAGAKIRKAMLFWSVLTNSAEAANPGMNIAFNGNPITGVKIGFVAGESPCFPQANTMGWKADVTSLVAGNGAYTVGGFPGGNAITGANFTEGATLAVLYDDKSSTLRRLVEYEGMAVTNSGGEVVSQALMGFTAGGAPVQATWYPVTGNGQAAADTLGFGSLNLGSTILDGSTAAKAAGTCSYTDSGTTECYWDDDNVNVSAAFVGGETSVTVVGGVPEAGGDCHSWLAMQLIVTTPPAQFQDFCAAGGAYADAQCPPGGTYKNHGAYLSCVAQAAEAYLAGQGILCEELQSCIVNPRARSGVGKP